MPTYLRRLGVVALAIALLTVTAGFAVHNKPAEAAGNAGAVFTMTNAADGNAVVAFARDRDGGLTRVGTYPTGGLGTGKPRLSSQGSLTLTDDRRFLLVANPGSNDVTTFAVAHDATLTLVDREASGGGKPVSITIDGNLVYVLNGGAPNNINGFRISRRGALTPLDGSTRPLSAEGVDPAQVQFNDRGDTLVVTEKASNKIDTFRVGRDGYTSGPVVHDSSGVTPFGLGFTRKGDFVVSEAFGGVLGKAAASSYSLDKPTGFNIISGSVGDGESEVCWVVISRDNRYAYVTNFQSGTISSYNVARDGTLTLDQEVAARTSPAFGPRDEASTRNGRLLYVIDIADPVVIGYEVQHDGSLVEVSRTHDGLPSTFAGIAVE